MKLFLLLVVGLNTLLAQPQLSGLVERVKRDVVRESLISGSSPVRRKRKATPFSRMMAVRNAVVRRAFDELSEVSLGKSSWCNLVSSSRWSLPWDPMRSWS